MLAVPCLLARVGLLTFLHGDVFSLQSNEELLGDLFKEETVGLEKGVELHFQRKFEKTFNILDTSKSSTFELYRRIAPTLRYGSVGAFKQEESSFFIEYTPEASFYSNEISRDETSHSLRVGFQKKRYANQWEFGMDYLRRDKRYSFSQSIWNQVSFRTHLDAKYVMSSSFNLHLGVFYAQNFFDEFPLWNVSQYGVSAHTFYRLQDNLSLSSRWGYIFSSYQTGGSDERQFSSGVDLKTSLTKNIALEGGVSYLQNGKLEAGREKKDKGVSYHSNIYINFHEGARLTGHFSYRTKRFIQSSEENDYAFFSYKWGFEGELMEDLSLEASLFGRKKSIFDFLDNSFVATGVSFQATQKISEENSLYMLVAYQKDDRLFSQKEESNLANNYYACKLGFIYTLTNGVIFDSSVTCRQKASNQEAHAFNELRFSLSASYVFW